MSAKVSVFYFLLLKRLLMDFTFLVCLCGISPSISDLHHQLHLCLTGGNEDRFLVWGYLTTHVPV